mmetsp:Transcript_5891/g.10509  ORF Transcript_5891/g.10509 Transcript_5891/m.10509 type:complete len:169 (+) Transcript_5891:67-573(+)|eukprot:CAMPEP_0197655196 /NCGR_PEP_ID=MMETSP1338-20131121/39310_1 /TAXON_ID=43686 ORGANISM="Pelagodinium beii, Strain RCC1491" /NCGR_SAMPLE_ID=MMETSP1338 /ASSEMBLY_ACC=CAM_ASM_000754 /LENGTH=168 /DNA_ID=CAMNT_0043230795 /DNA_START=67 /DNA_END=573 /DNA_ORIENTATION=-
MSRGTFLLACILPVACAVRDERNHQDISTAGEPGGTCTVYCNDPYTCKLNNGDKKRCWIQIGQPHNGKPEWCLVPYHVTGDGKCAALDFLQECNSSAHKYCNDDADPGLLLCNAEDQKCKKACKRSDDEKYCPACESNEECAASKKFECKKAIVVGGGGTKHCIQMIR